MSGLTDEQRERLKAIAAGTSENGAGPDAESPSAPAIALAESRVDLVAMIRDGIPEPTYVPGCAPWLRTGKRYLCPAPSGDGKSLTWLVVAVSAVEAGATVVMLDVENGADEYAARLRDILSARDADGTLAQACQQRLHYHVWPTFSLSWAAGDWADAIGGTDLVIFDSSRMVLTSVGLGEDKSDDYAVFVEKLLIPLGKAGTTTVVLDNTGHENKERARGTKAKADLNEVVYKLVVAAPFDRDRAGSVRLVRRRTRFAELPREVRIDLGGGIYASPVVAVETTDEGERQFRPTVLMGRMSRAIEDTPGMTQRWLLASVTGKRAALCTALRTLIQEGYVEARQEGKTAALHYALEPYRESDDEVA